MHQEPLEAAEVLGHELGLRVAAEPGRQLLLQPLETVAVSVNVWCRAANDPSVFIITEKALLGLHSDYEKLDRSIVCSSSLL